MPDLLEEASATLSEIVRIKSLMVEMIETLTLATLYVRGYAEKNNVPLPDFEKLDSLINKAESLRNEVVSGAPPFLQHRFKTPKDSTEPHRFRIRAGFALLR